MGYWQIKLILFRKNNYIMLFNNIKIIYQYILKKLIFLNKNIIKSINEYNKHKN